MVEEFLQNFDGIAWSDRVDGIVGQRVIIGKGRNALEVAVATSSGHPTANQLHSLWRERKSNRACPLVLVVLHQDRVSICGHAGESPPIHYDLPVDQVERICATALKKPSRHAADRFLRSVLPQLEQKLIGILNRGLVSSHELLRGVPQRSDWGEAGEKSVNILSKEGRDILTSLGYTIERLEGPSYLLKDHERETAIAVLLEEDEAFSQKQVRFGEQTPTAYALSIADQKRLEYVILLSGRTLRLHCTNPSAGFGSRGRTDTFIEGNLDLITKESAAYIWLLYSAEALRQGGSLKRIMRDSKDYATDLGGRLRERVYDRAVPDLAKSIFRALGVQKYNREQLDELYRLTLFLLYRILLVAYAEDEGFLPRVNPRYWEHSLKKKAREILEMEESGVAFDGRSSEHWDDLMTLFRAIHDGNREWSLPAYDGRLFSSDAKVSPEGARLTELSITNDQFGPILTNLLIDQTEDSWRGPVDFRDLSVREFGEIYEGLLESQLSIAEQPLATESRNGEDVYVPADDEDIVTVDEGDLYLHGTSGERKSTGTYYTKTIFIEHLLDNSLEPALALHLSKLDGLDEEKAGEVLFDFRVADIAMGSGHFLVAAIDRIEKAFSSYLARRPLPAVSQQLARLKNRAIGSYPDSETAPEIDTSQVLRRQIARRCIYGVDVNPLAVELARLSIWVHTFVPGIPLTYLDHNLVQGDSLSGIATIEEVADLLNRPKESMDEFQELLTSFFGESISLKSIQQKVRKLGRLADSDAEEIREARETQRDLDEELKDVRALMDILAAGRIDDGLQGVPEKLDSLWNGREHTRAKKILGFTNALHFPVAFPEVFQDRCPGFDVVVGNPPWEEETLEIDGFWARYAPGLQALPQSERAAIIEELEKQRPDLSRVYREEKEMKDKRRTILTNGPYPGMDTGDPDLYKAFCWRFLMLCKEEGFIGVVLPRTVFAGKGSQVFREALFENTVLSDVTFLLNNRQWVFNTHPQYTIALLSAHKTAPPDSPSIHIRGPYSDRESFLEGREKGAHTIKLDRIQSISDSSSLPLLPDDPRAITVFKKMSECPPLAHNSADIWRARPYTDLHATNDKKLSDGATLMHFDLDSPPEGAWPVWKGETFDIWAPDTGRVYAYAEPEIALKRLYEKRERSYRLGSRSAFHEMDEEWIESSDTLPPLHPRIAFRDITRSTDTRTVRAALVPPEVFLVNTAPYLFWPRGDRKDESYLLGMMSSIPFDWFSRRFVETHLNFYILNSLPVPRPSRRSPLWKRIVMLSGRLAAVDDRYREWAEEVGVTFGPLQDDEKMEFIHELDAVVAHLFSLSREDVKVIFSTFHDNWDYRERLANVIRHYDEWTEKLDDTKT